MNGKDVGSYNNIPSGRYGREPGEVIKYRAKNLSDYKYLDSVQNFSEIYDYIFKNKLPDRIKHMTKKKMLPVLATGVLFFEGDKIVVTRNRKDRDLKDLIKKFEAKNVEIVV